MCVIVISAMHPTKMLCGNVLLNGVAAEKMHSSWNLLLAILSAFQSTLPSPPFLADDFLLK